MPKRFGVYMPQDLEKSIEECMRILGVRSKSRLIQEALRSFIAEHEWASGGRVAGIIGVVYNHEAPGVDEKLTEVQHNYLDVIVCHVHIHLSKERCMLVIIVRGDAEKIRNLLREISGIRGVMLSKPLILAGE